MVRRQSPARTPLAAFFSILIVIAWLLLSLPAFAHKPSDSYLSLSIQRDQVEGQWDIALRDLADAIIRAEDGPLSSLTRDDLELLLT